MTDLSPVIEEVSTGTDPMRSYQKIVEICDGKVVTSGRGIISSLFGPQRRAFLVSNSSGGAIARRRDLSVTVAVLAGTYQVRLDYEVECPPGQEETAVNALAANSSPQVHLEYLIGCWVRTFVSEHATELLNDHGSLVPELERHLTERAKQETALTLTARTYLEEPRWLRPKRLEPFHFPVRPCDVDLEVDMVLSGELVVDLDKKRLSSEAAGRLDELVARIPADLADHTSNNHTLHQLFAECDSTVRSDYEAVVNDLLAPVGRKCGRIGLSGGPQIPGLVTEDDVRWRAAIAVYDQPEPITLEVRVLLSLLNLGSYVQAGCPDLKEEILATLEHFTRWYLSDLAHVQLCQRQEALKEQLTQALTTLATSIGYEAQSTVRFPGLARPQTEPNQVLRKACHQFPGVIDPVEVTVDLLLHIDDADCYADAGSPEFDMWAADELRRVVTNTLQGYTYTGLCLHTADAEKEISTKLQERADDVGLRTVNPQVTIRGLPEAPELLSVRHQSSLSVTGLVEPLTVDCTARLELVDAAAFQEDQIPDLDRWTKEQIQRVFEDGVIDLTLIELYRNPNAVEEMLAESFGIVAKGIGYQGNVTISVTGLDLNIPATITCQQPMSISLRSHPTPVELRAEALLELEDAERYIAADRPELDGWFQGRLKHATGNAFGLTYPELCLELEEVLAGITEHLTADIQEIGYTGKVSLEIEGVDPHDPRFLQLPYQVPLEVPDATELVEFRAMILLELIDEERLAAADIVDLSTWMRHHVLVAAAPLAILPYRSLSLLAKEQQERIRQTVVERAKEIGYSATCRIVFHGLDTSVLAPCHPSVVVQCRVSGSAESVQVNTEMMLQVNEPQTYLDSDCPPLEIWAHEQVPNTVADYLYSVRYTDLCIDLDSHKAEIEKRVRDAAGGLGVDVKQLTTFTDLLLERIRNGLKICIEGGFPTRVAGIDVGLELKAEFRIIELERLRETIDKHPDLVEHIESTVRRRLEQELRNMDPALFYTEFQEPTPTGGPPVSWQIEEYARAVLEEKFHADVLDIGFRQHETELSRRYKALATLHPFTVTVESLHGEPDLRFRGTLVVEAIDGADGWHRFNQMAPTPEEVTRRAVEHLNAELTDAPFEDIFGTSNDQIRRMVQSTLSRRIAADYGLVVSLSSLRREAMKVEQLAANRRQELWASGIENAKRLQQIIADLRTQYFEAIASRLVDDAGIDELRTRIRMLEEEERSLQDQYSVQPIALKAGSTKALGPGSPDEETGEQ
jgi:hypothetical protein